MAVRAIYHTGIVVSNLEKSLLWYSEVLGLTVEREPRELSGEWISAVLGMPGARLKMAWVGTNGASSIELDEFVVPKGELVERNPLLNELHTSHVGIEVDDVTAEYGRLKRLGVRFAGSPPEILPNKYPWAKCAVFLQDPDGNWIELLEREAPRESQ